MVSYPKCNLHTHTSFCDGKDSPEEIVREAIGQGLQVIGFSGHSHTSFDPGYCMNPESTIAYRHEIERLKKVYGDMIRILCGIEQDLYTEEPARGFDYTIGSVHYVLCDGTYRAVDLSEKDTRQTVAECFGGDFYRYAAAYYETVAQVARVTDCDIIGHFDLIEKFNEHDRMFATDDYRYRRPMMDALDELLKHDVIFEINTGAMARGYRSMPYPSPYVLRRIAEKRGRVILSSDAHKKEALTYAFEDAVRYARSCGVGGFTVPTKNGWEILPLNSKTLL